MVGGVGWGKWSVWLEYWNVSDVVVDGSSLMVPLTLIPSAASKGAVGHGSGANSWLIQLEGGGWCNNIRSCVFRKTTRRGSSKYMEKFLAFTGLLSNKPDENPDFYNWNRVKLRYCDGASFSGEGYNEAAGLFFRGQRTWQAGMEELMSIGMRNANQALLVVALLEDFRRYCTATSSGMFPRSIKVKCLADAGLFLDTVDIAGAHALRTFYDGVVTLQGVAKNLPLTCTSRMDATSCFFPQNLINNIRTPLFLLNSAYDMWQLYEAIAPPSADPRGTWKSCQKSHMSCDASKLTVLQGFRNQMLNTVKAFSESTEKGLFINSCFAHCQSELQDTWFSKNSPSLGKKRIAEAVGDWYFDRSRIVKIDCPYPCDNTCHHLN